MNLLATISFYTILLPSGMVLFRFKNIDFETRLVSILVLVTLFIDLFSLYYISDYFKSDTPKNNMFLFHIFTLIEGVSLLIYFSFFFKQKILKVILYALSVVYSTISIINVFCWEPLDFYPSIPRTIECLMIMILSIIFFINLFLRSSVINLLSYSHFWLVSGLLLYFAGTFFMNIVGQIVLDDKKLGFDVYDIHSLLNIFLNIIYTIALWMSSRRLISAQ